MINQITHLLLFCWYNDLIQNSHLHKLINAFLRNWVIRIVLLEALVLHLTVSVYNKSVEGGLGIANVKSGFIEVWNCTSVFSQCTVSDNYCVKRYIKFSFNWHPYTSILYVSCGFTKYGSRVRMALNTFSTRNFRNWFACDVCRL